VNTELLQALKEITIEEEKILNERDIVRSIYTEDTQFIVDSKKLLALNKLITVRTHTRFSDFPEHRHNYIEMMYVCEGSITHQIDNSEVVLHKGEILLLNQHTWHSIKRAGMDDIAINLIILPEFFDKIYSIIGYNSFIADFLINILRSAEKKSEYLLFRVSDVLEIQNLMENIIFSLSKQGDEDRYKVQITMGLLFLYLTKYVNKTQDSTSTEFEKLLIDSAVTYINENYRNASLTELAKMLNQPVYVLSKLIKQKTLYTFKDLLQRKKFESAEELLKNTKHSIDEIIAAVGYENNSYFFKKFKEKYGITPAKFRKTNTVL
jgi:AraC-like DNA-binding protein/mannose-6-phosphate isomerase-like protein (cupin superfamily)